VSLHADALLTFMLPEMRHCVNGRKMNTVQSDLSTGCRTGRVDSEDQLKTRVGRYVSHRMDTAQYCILLLL
jgi:hypothetical protein